MHGLTGIASLALLTFVAGCGDNTVQFQPRFHKGELVCMVLNNRCAMVTEAWCNGNRCWETVRMRTMDDHDVEQFEIAKSCGGVCKP